LIFSSPDFVFGFLPFALIVFLVAKRLGGTWAIGAIVVLSSIFYSAWDIRFLPLLLGSVLFNYAIAQALDRVSGERTRTLIYGAAVVINLAAICYFKYSNFALSNFAVLAGRSLTPIEVILPLGISFFTFQNIVYINGVWQRKYPAGRLLDYASCIVFFPHLIAGPIVLYQDLIHQFQAIRASRFPKPEYEVGGFIFVVGLFKKLVLADSLAPVADAVFSNTTNAPLLFQEAWFGALAYTFQIYFDFSGYSDMAIGLGLLFGVRLPLNFFSPYKATNIIDFWHTWHMTLSRFLREYVYIPLGGNRRGRTRRYVNLMLTMLLGGLWHGAGWTFVAWGALHGIYLCINHGWRALEARRPRLKRLGIIGWPLTFVAVVMAWVFFRAPNMSVALSILGAMTTGAMTGPGTGAPLREELLLTSAAICFLLPNTIQWAGYDPHQAKPPLLWYQFRPSAAFGFATGVMLLASVAYMTRISPFIYFQF
jgi:D-alanyl-lipoteichoic acid acyltransferase DltB (MBOAT superfamily)